MLRKYRVTLLVLVMGVGAGCPNPKHYVRFNGKLVDTTKTSGQQMAQNYYGPELARLKLRPKPLDADAVFAVPNPEYAGANWVRGSSLSQTQRRFFADFTRGSYLMLAAALKNQKVFRSFKLIPTVTGTSDLGPDAKLSPGVLVIGHTAQNKVMVHRHPHRSAAITIKEKPTPKQELTSITNLLIGAIARLSTEAQGAALPSKASPTVAAIVAVFDVQASRIKLPDDLRHALGDLAASKLAASRSYRVIPRTQIRARLRKEKRASYRSCIDSACQVEIGRELAAQKTLAITITKIGSSCNVNAVLYDLKQAASERAASASGPCSEDGYAKSITKAVTELSGTR